MSTPSSDKRPKLLDIVRGNAADFNSTWHETEATSRFDPLPPGEYRCLITDGRLFTSRSNSTPGFKIEIPGSRRSLRRTQGLARRLVVQPRRYLSMAKGGN